MDLAAVARFWPGRRQALTEYKASRSNPDGNPVRKDVISGFWLSTGENEAHHGVPIVAADRHYHRISSHLDP